MGKVGKIPLFRIKGKFPLFRIRKRGFFGSPFSFSKKGIFSLFLKKGKFPLFRLSKKGIFPLFPKKGIFPLFRLSFFEKGEISPFSYFEKGEKSPFSIFARTGPPGKVILNTLLIAFDAAETVQKKVVTGFEPRHA